MRQIDPRDILGMVGGANGLNLAASPPGPQPQPPMRVFFHGHANVLWAGPDGLPPGVEITSNETGEAVDVYVMALDVHEEDGRHAKHIVWFDGGGVAKMLDHLVGLLAPEVLEALAVRVQREALDRELPGVVGLPTGEEES